MVNNYNCKNIFSGFQALHPRLFTLTSEVLGDILCQKLPFNVQCALGNWLECIGDAIIAYNSKQMYFQSGPGRYYNIIYKNVTNPFCTSNGNTPEESNNSDLFFNASGSRCYNENITVTSDNEDIEDSSIDELYNILKYLEFELQKLKKEIDIL